jgi:branched-chain amino acid transport system substrate-binding protein
MTIGLVWPESSEETEKQYTFAAGAQYAVDDFERSGQMKGICKGIRLKMIDEGHPQEDDLDSSLKSVLNDPTLAALLGFVSSVDAHRAAIASSNRNVLVITPMATWPALTKHGFENLIRLTPDDSDFARLLGKFVKSRGYKNVGIIYSMLPHGNSVSPLIVEELAKQKVQVTFVHAYAPNMQPTYPDVLDIIGPLLKRNGDIDALFMIDDLSASPAMLLYLRKAGVNIPILASDSLDFPEIWKTAGRAAEGICFVSTRSSYADNSPVSKLYKRVVDVADRKLITIDKFAHYGFLSGYETMNLYLSAVKESGSFYPKQLGIVLRNKTWDTLQGKIEFTADGDAVGRNIYINEIVSGHPEVVMSEIARKEDK